MRIRLRAPGPGLRLGALLVLCGGCDRKVAPPAAPADAVVVRAADAAAAPVVPPLPPPELYMLAKRHLREGDLDHAILLFDKLIALDVSPEMTANALLGIGAAYADKGDRKGALAAYERLVALRPRDVEARRILGVAFEDTGALVRAATELEKAAELAPDELTVFHDLGRIYRRQGKEDAAVKSYARYERERARLVKALGLSKDAKVRIHAAEQLAAVPDDATGRALTLALDDRAPEVRLAVVKALADQRYVPAKGPLRALAEKDDDEDVADAARKALSAILRSEEKAKAEKP